MKPSNAGPRRLDDGTDLHEFLGETDVALVMFYTVGCGKCQAMEPVLGTVSRATGVEIGLCNPGDDLGLVEAYDIRSVPTLVLFEDGESVARLADGFVQTATIVEFLSTHVPSAVEGDPTIG